MPSRRAERSEPWVGRNILVTGAGGFIGSQLAEALVRAGASVRAFVRYTSRGDHGWLLYGLVPQSTLVAVENRLH